KWPNYSCFIPPKGESVETQFDNQAWLEILTEEREQTADYYLNSFDWRGAPIPQDYEGPRYYPPNPEWRLNARLDRQAPGTGMRVQLPTSVGDLRDFDVAGAFVFTVDDQEHRLTAYSMAPAHPEHDVLFAPFRDATSGKETYGAGRYLDIPRQESDDNYILDFNMAYNPSCAYSPRWNCPYPPPQHNLKIAVEAGEKVPYQH